MQTQRRFNALTKQEQDAALAAFDKAGALAVEGGADEARVADVLRRHTADLSLDDDGHAFLSVETPQFRYRPVGFEYLPAWTASEMIIGGTGPEAVDGPHTTEAIAAHFYATNVEIRPMKLLDAVKVLASDQSPALFLTGQRAKLAELRAARRRELDEGERLARAQAEESARYKRDNAERIAEWDRTPREAQLLYLVADKQPEFAPVLNAVAAAIVKHRDPRYGITMPRAWRLAELAPAQAAVEFVRSAGPAELLATVKPDAPPAMTVPRYGDGHRLGDGTTVGGVAANGTGAP